MYFQVGAEYTYGSGMEVIRKPCDAYIDGPVAFPAGQQSVLIVGHHSSPPLTEDLRRGLLAQRDRYLPGVCA